MDARRKQQIVTVGGVAVAGTAVVVAGSFVLGGANRTDTFQGAMVEPSVINAPLAAASPENLWREQGEARLSEMSAELAAMRRANDELERRVTVTLRAFQEDADDTLSSVVDQLASMETSIQNLGSRVEAGVRTPVAQGPGESGVDGGGTAPFAPVTPASVSPSVSGAPRVPFGPTAAGATGGVAPATEPLAPGVNDVAPGWMGWGASAECNGFGCSFAQPASLESDRSRRPADGNYIPAGSYAPAVVLSGADAVTGVSSRENPTPVILRVMGPAVTAGEDTVRGETVEITGCIVTGSATGDLSSERVYVRFIKMTCIRDGEAQEVNIAGYLSGAGKAGVRGPVVSRVGPAVRNAALAGVASGAGQIASLAGQAQLAQGGLDGTAIAQGVGTTALGGGLSGAADTLSEYYIERAEQYQPVVSLYSGTKVEVVFMEGVFLDDEG